MAMDCPACHAENAADAATCSACGKPLREAAQSPRKPVRRSGPRRRASDDSDGTTDTDPAAWRAYRVSLWSMIPGAGLLLGPVALVLGLLAARKITEDEPSRNRAKVAVLFGALVTLTQWLGVALMVYGW